MYENHGLMSKASIAKKVFAVVLVASRFTLHGYNQVVCINFAVKEILTSYR